MVKDDVLHENNRGNVCCKTVA